MSRFGIVVIGYNRVNSIDRLLSSLNSAYYDEDVDLIISIDNSGTDCVENYANQFSWKFGKKIVRTFESRLGLRKHVLTCGNYLNEYGFEAVIVLEDDICVSPAFFSYSKKAAEFYAESDFVAGISLYTHHWNANADRPFYPIQTNYDAFFMQYPQSWGQVWLKKQWNDFYSWYRNGDYKNLNSAKVPSDVLAWPETSWLKYHIQYCIDQNKYFVYPYTSLSTNFADQGTHYKYSTNKMQVSLLMGDTYDYKFPNSMSDASVYDAYFENSKMSYLLNVPEEELCVDLYGKKRNLESRYILNTISMPYKVVKSFGLQMRPWDMNVVYGVPGNDIYLYDTFEAATIVRNKHRSLTQWAYDTRGIVLLKRNFMDIIAHEIFNKIRVK
ncbi:glycosyltransferase family 2 protein [Paenibacillus koleovorans]|uniref:glycosyltransferase family 2 protein n=1 Tax=Paenibacillus koleovorans TaxID=121608 RepID=UPI000FD811B4|nr:glycosyltransferase family 2 protein [Paenibacillus koleovorans]